jgi:hypothetical protein
MGHSFFYERRNSDSSVCIASGSGTDGRESIPVMRNIFVSSAASRLGETAFPLPVLLKYLDVTVQEKLRSGWAGPFVKVEECCG